MAVRASYSPWGKANLAPPLVITLDQDLIARCIRFGEEMIFGYAVGRMTDRKVYAKADKDARLQGLAKMAECAFAILNRRSPDDLDWFGEHKNGEGHDLVVEGFRFDVKHTERGKRLIWPLTKNADFWTKDFNSLALVVGSPPSFEIAGIVGKTRFDREKETARQSDGSGLTPGTWFLHRSTLSSPSLLSWLALPIGAAPCFPGFFNDEENHPHVHRNRARRRASAQGGDGGDPEAD